MPLQVAISVRHRQRWILQVLALNRLSASPLPFPVRRARLLRAACLPTRHDGQLAWPVRTGRVDSLIFVGLRTRPNGLVASACGENTRRYSSLTLDSSRQTKRTMFERTRKIFTAAAKSFVILHHLDYKEAFSCKCRVRDKHWQSWRILNHHIF